MRSTLGFAAALLALFVTATPAAGQQLTDGSTPDATTVPKATTVATPDAAAAAEAAEAESSWKKGRPVTMQYYRALDKRGIGVFETTKDPGVAFTGFKFDLGAAF